MNVTTGWRLLIAAAAAALLAGCTKTTKPAELRPEDEPFTTQSRVQFQDSKVKYSLRVVRVDAQRLPGGLLKVYLDLRNRTKEDLVSDIRTTFLDADGHVLEQGNWEPILIPARSVKEYTYNSISPQAADYQVIVRRPAKARLNLQ